jgi:hypothetical protein
VSTRKTKRRPVLLTLADTAQGGPLMVPCDNKGKALGSVISSCLSAAAGDAPLLVVTYRLRPGSFRVIDAGKAVSP